MKILYDRRGPIGWVTLSAPPRNALTDPVFADAGELGDFLSESSLRAVIVRGEGRHFSAGADLRVLESQRGDPEALGRRLDAGKKLLEALSFATVPVLAAIRGSCLGAGLEIALACHFRFAAEGSLLGFPEAEQGLMPGFGGTVLGADAVPRRVLAELMLSGRMVGAPEALELGLVQRVCPAPELEPLAIAFLEELSSRRAPLLVRSVMEAIHNGRRLSRDDALRRETELFCKVLRAGREE
jgi:enoyl-CoA hydratase